MRFTFTLSQQVEYLSRVALHIFCSVTYLLRLENVSAPLHILLHYLCTGGTYTNFFFIKSFLVLRKIWTSYYVVHRHTGSISCLHSPTQFLFFAKRLKYLHRYNNLTPLHFRKRSNEQFYTVTLLETPLKNLFTFLKYGIMDLTPVSASLMVQ